MKQINNMNYLIPTASSDNLSYFESCVISFKDCTKGKFISPSHRESRNSVIMDSEQFRKFHY
jgi:hypothetical protein